MKKKFPISLLLMMVVASFVISGCATNSEKLAELQESQSQMKQEVVQAKQKVAKYDKLTNKYEKLSNKYEGLVQEQSQQANKLQDTYTELQSKDDQQILVMKEVVKDKLIQAAQDSIHLEKRLKRYQNKAKMYKEKSIKMQEVVEENCAVVKNTQKEIEKVKQEIASQEQSESQNNG